MYEIPIHYENTIQIIAKQLIKVKWLLATLTRSMLDITEKNIIQSYCLNRETTAQKCKSCIKYFMLIPGYKTSPHVDVYGQMIM